MPNTIIFPHIPKCAGTSLLRQFESSDLRVFLDYDTPPHLTNKYMKKLCERRNRESMLLDFSNFDLVYGHFPIERYKNASYRYVALLRDPIERAISHFHYWKDLPESNLVAVQRNPIIKSIKSGEIGFSQFVEQTKLAGFLNLFLNEMPPSNFILVGFVDRFDRFAYELGKLLGIEIRPDVMDRKGHGYPIAKAEIEKATHLLAPETAIYQSFRDQWLD